MIPRVRRYPRKPIVRAVDPCRVAAAGNRVFGKRYARIAHCFTPELVLALDKVTADEVPSTVFRYAQAALAAYETELARLLPVSQGEPQ